jgi:hypothetical protein
MVQHLLGREYKAKRKRNKWGFLKGGTVYAVSYWHSKPYTLACAGIKV